MSFCCQPWCLGIIPKHSKSMYCDLHLRYPDYRAPKWEHEDIPVAELCDECDGEAECWHCDGTGDLEFECCCHHGCGEIRDETCTTCDGLGHCQYCDGKGTDNGTDITADVVLDAISKLNERRTRQHITQHVYDKKKAKYDKLYKDLTKELRLEQFDKWVAFTGKLHPLDIRNVAEAVTKVELDPKLFEAVL